MRWEFDKHGRARSTQRGIPGTLVDIVLENYDQQRAGRVEDTLIRTGDVDDARLSVLFWAGEPAIVHSVWWESS